MAQQLRGSGPPDESEGPTTLSEAVRMIAAEVEDRFGVPLEVVVVGDCPLDERLTAQMLAAREAMANAAKYAGVGGPVQVYAEVEGPSVFVSVRDRGPGFDLDSVPEDRKGIRESIVGRMERHGGTARLRAVPEGGTDVELEIERTPEAMSKDVIPLRSDAQQWEALVARHRGELRQERQTGQYERVRRQRRARRAVRRAEAFAVVGLIALAVAGYAVSAFATHDLLESLQHRRFSPSDTAQVITAIGGLTTAVGFSVAGVLKALALLVHARADMVRAREGLPPGDGAAVAGEGEPPTADQTA
ncbi:hypothetical protein Slala02_53490 [Streptomyces lavendulae subsp. lavendulae]|nr:hypothetical protein Slala01_06660 [Streptomyces lavendulae subsp. lavendulae]GLX29529.1 hypothetical protein Slala02_53490 [Streptomyces lavendulae subsp. lavendulae]